MTWFFFFKYLLQFPREGNGTPLQPSCLENPMDGGAWWAAVQGVVKSRTRLSDFIFTFHFHALEKEMVTHSSVLAWRIPGTGEPHGLPSMGSHRVGHDWSDLAVAAAAVMSLLLNMLSRLVITFLPRSQHLLISWLQSPSAMILEPPPKKYIYINKIFLFLAVPCVLRGLCSLTRDWIGPQQWKLEVLTTEPPGNSQ